MKNAASKLSPTMEPKQDSLLRIEKEQKVKEELGALNEELEATGQESEEGAVKWVVEVNKEQEKTDAEIKARQDEFFEEKSHKSFRTYIYSLAELTFNLLKYHVEWPPHCDFKVLYDEQKGIGVRVFTPDGTYARGFTPVKERKYDLNAVNVLIMQVENTLEEFFPEPETDTVSKNEDMIYDLKGDTIYQEKDDGTD